MTEPNRRVGWWLAIWAGMLLVTVTVGGLTRLTDSGLSITEWRPVTGVVPPLGEAAWQREFAKYQRIPEYQRDYPTMTVAQFQRIYYWEYGHRLWARIVGLALAVPLAWFWFRGALTKRLKRRLLGVLALTGLQGAMGWYMVQSGLTIRTDVSQYRLAAHLGVALAIIAVTVWTAAELLWRPTPIPDGKSGIRSLAVAWTGLVLATALAGALVAGLDAGKVYNEFPLMGGRLVPAGYFALDPWWANPGRNVIAVQFNHRVLAWLSLAGAIWLAIRLARPGQAGDLRRLGWLIGGVATAQFSLGVATLLSSVRIEVAVLHQAGAVVLFSLGVLLLARLSPRRLH